MSYVNSDGEHQLIWWSSFFSRHLEDGWVAVVMEVEHQGLEYIGATGYAYNNKMEREQMSLAAIVIEGDNPVDEMLWQLGEYPK